MSEWRKPGNTAVITGGANGIGLAAARQFRRDGMNVLIADRDEEALAAALEALTEAGGRGEAAFEVCDVSDFVQLEALRDAAYERFGAVHCLMNNAGTSIPTGAPWENLGAWKKLVEINLWGIVHGCQAFVPAMLEAGVPGVVINTGSKQGITKPPGNYAYNLSKAGVLAYTESLAHAFRQIENCPLSAHLLVPGFTYTNMIAQFVPEKPAAAWTPEQVVDFLLASLEKGDFYVLCPDNDVTREMDEKRIAWSAGDMIENRPALSRWHPDFQAAFEAFMKG
ncbi:MAG: SDR family NAD(P)-dependent oxidoreductase [Parvibaculaceae bacterium]